MSTIVTTMTTTSDDVYYGDTDIGDWGWVIFFGFLVLLILLIIVSMRSRATHSSGNVYY